mmetsp:Transcript_19122/g.27524  ORF Transcript_19122/g.27524 Transcript_19122/m.27524 type:complete len:173 (-) Transcript_19122:52-570(-)
MYDGYYVFWCFMVFILPLQGFMNSLVYFRPRLARRWERFRKASCIVKKQESRVGNTSRETSSSWWVFSRKTFEVQRSKTSKTWIAGGRGSMTLRRTFFDSIEPAAKLAVLNSRKASTEDPKESQVFKEEGWVEHGNLPEDLDHAMIAPSQLEPFFPKNMSDDTNEVESKSPE